jgi:hypothetical protein
MASSAVGVAEWKPLARSIWTTAGRRRAWWRGLVGMLRQLLERYLEAAVERRVGMEAAGGRRSRRTTEDYRNVILELENERKSKSARR